jgi:hypothetical protein
MTKIGKKTVSNIPQVLGRNHTVEGQHRVPLRPVRLAVGSHIVHNEARADYQCDLCRR